MSRNSSDINFSDVRIAAQNLNHMLQHQDLEARHSPDPSRSDHIETAEEADQIFRDEILAQHLKKRHSDLGGDIRPPRYSQVVDQTSRFTRDEEMLERPSSRGGQPPRYSQVFGRGQRDARGEEALARQIRDGYNSSLAVNESSSSLDPRDPRATRHHRRRSQEDRLARQMQDQYNSSLAVEQSSSRSRRPSRYTQTVDEPSRKERIDGAVARQIRDQYNSSLAVNDDHTSSTSRPPKYDSSSHPPPYSTHPRHYTHHSHPSAYHQQSQDNERSSFDLLRPGHHAAYSKLVDDDDICPREGLESRGKARKQKKPQIRAKDHEGALRWLACRRGLSEK